MNKLNARTRNAIAKSMHDAGATYKEIGQELGLSTSWAREVVEKAKREEREAQNPRWYYGLSVRAVGCLVTEGFKSEEEVRNYIKKHGDLPKTTPNLGKVTRKEIFAWLGVALPQTPNTSIKAAITLLQRAGYEVKKRI